MLSKGSPPPSAQESLGRNSWRSKWLPLSRAVASTPVKCWWVFWCFFRLELLVWGSLYVSFSCQLDDLGSDRCCIFQASDCFSQWLHTHKHKNKNTPFASTHDYFDLFNLYRLVLTFIRFLPIPPISAKVAKTSWVPIGAPGRFQPKDKAGLVNFEEEQFLEVSWLLRLAEGLARE